MIHRYATRKATRAADGTRDRVIILQESDDPTHLPDYRPVAEGVSSVVARSRRMGVDFALRQVSEDEFRHSAVPGVRGLPMIWARDGFGGIEVFPEPLDDYEIIRTEARTVLFSNPQDPDSWVARLYGGETPAAAYDRLRGMGPVDFAESVLGVDVQPWQRGILNNIENTRMLMNEVAGIPRHLLEGGFRLDDNTHAQQQNPIGRVALCRQIIELQNRNGGVAPETVRASPEAWAALAADFPMPPADMDTLSVMGVPIVFDRFVPPGEMYVMGVDPAYHGAGATAVAEVRDGCIVGVRVTNAGAGYTALPGIGFNFDQLGFHRIDPETVQRSRERARGLLKSLLTPAQWAEYEKSRTVTERIGDSVFKLRPGDMIEARKKRLIGSIKERWCVNPDPWADGNDFMPEEDKLIGQLLHLRAGPDKLRAQANVFKG
jgi:hypothetical protein